MKLHPLFDGRVIQPEASLLASSATLNWSLEMECVSGFTPGTSPDGDAVQV